MVRLPVALVLGAGIVISVLAAQTIQGFEDRRAQATFDLAAEQTIDAIQDRISQHTQLIYSIVSLFHTSLAVGREEFSIFVAPALKRNDAIQSVGWAPRVPDVQRDGIELVARRQGLANFEINERTRDGQRRPAARRDEYYPTYFLAPASTNEVALGFDQASHPVRREALERARDTGEVALSGRVELTLAADNRAAVLAFAPIYWSRAVPETVEARRQDLAGFAYAQIRPARIVDALAKAPTVGLARRVRGLRVEIFDTTDAANPGHLFTYVLNAGDKDSAPDPRVKPGDFISAAEFGGRQWSFIARSDAMAPGVAWQSWATLVASLALTGLLAAYLHATLSRARSIEMEVGLRTNELKLTNQLLRASEDRIRAIADSVPAMIAYVDRDMTYQFANRRYLDIGIDPETMIGRTMREVRGDADFERVKHHVERALAGEQVSFELASVDRNGRSHHFAIECAPDVADGRVKGFYVLARDMSEQRRTEHELDEFFIQSLTLMSVISFDGFLRRFNPTWRAALGYSYDELMSSHFLTIVHPDDRERAEAALHSLVSGGEALNLELRLVHKDGGDRTFLWNATYDPQERQIYATGHDITALKAVDRMKDEFVSTVSHELRTPLTSIKGALGLIRAKAVGSLPAEMTAMLDIAYKNCDRLVLLINDILDIEKIEAGKMDFHMQPMDIVAAVGNAVAANQSYADQFGVVLELETDLAAATVRADEGRIMQVMANLLSNAAKFSRENGRVQVRVQRQGGMIRVSVEDHGIGIPDQFRARIFEKFSQLDSSDRRKVSGTGLGLSIVRAIVERHGGQVDFVSAAGAGTTFFVDLPELARAAEAVANETGALRVLVCEDDPDIAAVLSQIVERCGYAVDVAFTVQEAAACLARHAYAAMTLDLVLPDMNGLEFFKRLRADPKTRQLPIIIVSAVAGDSAQQINGSAVNVVDWLDKPFNEERLANAIRTAISMNAGTAKRILYIEDDSDLVQVVARQVAGEATVVAADSLGAARKILGCQRFDLAILDLMLPDGRGEELLPLMRNPDGSAIPVIVFSALEVPVEVARRVETVLVKTRTTDQMLITAIGSVVARNTLAAAAHS